jgi:hypothetical protein
VLEGKVETRAIVQPSRRTTVRPDDTKEVTMKTFRTLTALLACLALGGLSSARAADATHEMKSEVPALTSFHEVIFPLWHEAWPNKNYKMMKDLLPKVREHVAEVEKAELPGILRDKKAAWDKALAALKESVAQYEKAAAEGSEKGLLDAVESLHSRYEAMVRITRPVMKELDAFHVVLYRVYHKELLGKAFDQIAASATEMVDKCQALAAAAVPKRFASIEAKLKPEIALLCDKSAKLKAAAGGTDPKATTDAVEAVHDQYQGIEALFR